MKTFIAALALSVLASNASAALVIDHEVTDNEISTRYDEIDKLIKKDLSCKIDADCTTIALGSRACGGPQRFDVVSRQNSELDAIVFLAEELTKIESTFNYQNGVFSICSMEMEPEVACVQNACRAK